MVYYHASTTSPTTAVEFAAAVERAEREEALANAGNDWEVGHSGERRGGVADGRLRGGVVGAANGVTGGRPEGVAKVEGEGQRPVERGDSAHDGGQGALLEMVDRQLSQAVGDRGREKVEGSRAACGEPGAICERVERARRNADLRGGDVTVDGSKLVGKGTKAEPWVVE